MEEPHGNNTPSPNGGIYVLETGEALNQEIQDAVSITCLVCAAYVHLQADITTRMSNISALEKEIADLKTDNDTTLKRVNTSINLNEIKEKAIAELGMVYAAPDQVA